MSTKAYGITSGGVIKCSRVALIPASRGMRSTAGWVLFHCVESGWDLVCALSDESQSESRMREIRTSGLMSGERKRATASRPRTAPFLDSTCRSAHLARLGPPITFSSSCIWRHDASLSLESLHTLTRNGWYRWLAMLSMSSMALCFLFALLCMIAIQNSVLRFEQCFSPAECNPFCCRLVVQTSMLLPNVGYAPSRVSVYRS